MGYSIENKSIILAESKTGYFKFNVVLERKYENNKSIIILKVPESRIEQAKGNKDRYVNMPEELLKIFEDYYRKYKPQIYLLNGQENLKYTDSSIRKVVKRLTKKAGIKKNVSPHTFRHSFATHLLEDGVDIIYVHKLLGHQDIKTALIYTHISQKALEKVRSPLSTLRNK